jgi:mRNA-degrading endonuclease RelE of RelBE toxin-antitoxin system
METTPSVVVWSEVAMQSLQEVGNRSLQHKIYAKVSDLAREAHPERVGKPLHEELQGLYRIPFGRYRILYGVRLADAKAKPPRAAEVQIVLVGIRKAGHKKDVYEIASKLRRRGLI